MAVKDPNSTYGKSKDNLYYKLYSHCLDLLQFIFEHGKEKGKSLVFQKVEIQSSNDNFKQFKKNYGLIAQALEKANKEQGFNEKAMWLISYDNILLGGTSPFTFVFTSPNLEREIEEKYDRNSANPFYSNKKAKFFSNNPKDYLSLTERPLEFQKYFWNLLRMANTQRCASIVNCFDYDPKQWDSEITSIEAMFGSNEDADCPSLGISTQNGIELRYNNIKLDLTNVSQFAMLPNNVVYSGKSPLVLTSLGFDQPWQYIDDKWDSNTQITELQWSEQKETGKSFLPKPGSNGECGTIEYPWVTEWDFFTDQLYDLGYEINSDSSEDSSGKYFAPKLDNYPFRFLLPIKRDFFKYFNTKDLRKQLSVEAEAVDKATDEQKKDGKHNYRFRSVRFTLRIPLREGRFMALSRTYTNPDPKMVKKDQYGNTVESKFNIIELVGPPSQSLVVSIFPFYKLTTEGLMNEYTVQLYSEMGNKENVSDSDTKLLSLSFISCNPRNKDKEIMFEGESTGSFRSKYHPSTRIYKIRPDAQNNGPTDFDAIEVSNVKGSDSGTGLIVPCFREISLPVDDTSKYATFAIDFGTSNTHIAYCSGRSGNPEPFRISEDHMQMISLVKPASVQNKKQYRSDTKTSIGDDAVPSFSDYLREFVPPTIGCGKGLVKEVCYPVKTATLETPGKISRGIKEYRKAHQSDGHGEDWDYDLLFSCGNIGFDIDKEEGKLPNGKNNTNEARYVTDIKWGFQNCNKSENREEPLGRICLYFEQTLWMIKNLIVESCLCYNGINILYFYPESMPQKPDRENISKAWKTAKERVFDRCGFILSNTIDSPELESIAPYYALSKNVSLFNTNYMNIDVGGGTTDYFIFHKENLPQDEIERGYESSILFAGKNIWGDANPDRTGVGNGFIESMEKKMNKEGNQDAISLYEDYVGRKPGDGTSSRDLTNSDIVGFLFAHDGLYGFSNMIKEDPSLKFVLYLHYSSLIYYAYQMFRCVQEQDPSFEIPVTISFTGKGSEYIKLLDAGQGITDVTRVLLYEFFQENLNPERLGQLKVMFPENPKIITANGGVGKVAGDDKSIIWEKRKPQGSTLSFIGNQTKGDNVRYYDNLCDKLLGVDSTDVKYNDVLGHKEEVMKGVDDFIDVVLSSVMVDTLQTALNLMIPHDEAIKRKIHNFASSSYDTYVMVTKKQGKDGNTKVSNSLFFYALSTLLISLSEDLVKQN